VKYVFRFRTERSAGGGGDIAGSLMTGQGEGAGRR
jgi:hypothetical protein